MTCGPRIQSSPRSPSATSSPLSGSTRRHSVLGSGGPIEPGLVLPVGPDDVGDGAGLGQAVALDDVQSSRFATASASSPPSGAAPDITVCTEERSRPSTAGCLASARAIGGTT